MMWRAAYNHTFETELLVKSDGRAASFERVACTLKKGLIQR